VGICAAIAQERCQGGVVPACNPVLGATEEIAQNGLDDDCDGEIDESPCALGGDLVRLTNTPWPSTWTALASSDDDWLVGWVDDEPGRCGSVWLASLSAELEFLEGPRTFHGVCALGEGLTVATSGETDLVAVKSRAGWGEPASTFLGIVDRDGSVLMEDGEIVGSSLVGVVWTLGAYHLLWSSSPDGRDEIRHLVVSQNGQVLGAPRVVGHGSIGSAIVQQPPSVAATDDGLAVAWIRRLEGRDGFVVEVLLFEPEGGEPDPPLVAYGSEGTVVDPPRLTFLDGRLLVVIHRQEGPGEALVSVVIDTGARLRVGLPVVLQSPPNARPPMTTVVATATGFLVGARARVGAGRGLAFWPLSHDGLVLGIGPIVEREVQPGTLTLAPADGGALVAFSDCCYDRPNGDGEEGNSELVAGRIVCE